MMDTTDKNKYYDIFLTDMHLHVAMPTNPPSFFRQILKSFRKGGTSERVYSSDLTPNGDGTFHFKMPLSKGLKEEVELARRLGKKVRFLLPKGGLPIYAGKDTIQRVEADRKKLVDKLTE